MQISLYTYEELAEAAELMAEIYENEMKQSYCKEGRDVFEKQICLEALQKRFSQGNLFYKCEQKHAVLEMEKPCHIAFLFVKEKKEGIARALLKKAWDDTKEKLCTVGAFEGAVAFYEKMGFVKVGEEQNFHGMGFTLMAKVI